MTSITSLSFTPPSSPSSPSSSPTPLFKSPNLKTKQKNNTLFFNRKNRGSFSCCFNQENQERKSFSSINTLNISGFPLSLRIIKMKRRLKSNFPEPVPLSLELSIIKSISTLLIIFDELVKYKGDSMNVSREMSDAFVFMFKKVFFESTNLYFGVMELVADLVVFSVGKYSPKGLEEEEEEEELSEFDRTRIGYERLIFNDPDNAMILCNYAQFLYQIANDDDKAEELFKRVVQIKPVDAVAWSEYGLFLWQKRGDVEAAEEAFLEAIEVEPRNTFHESRYAWFLWETGGSDTCFPLTPTS